MFSIEIAIKWNDFWLVWHLLTVCDSITLGYRRRARAWQLHSTVSATRMDSWGPQSFEFAEMYLWCILVPSISTSSGTSVPICSSLHRKNPMCCLRSPGEENMWNCWLPFKSMMLLCGTQGSSRSTLTDCCIYGRFRGAHNYIRGTPQKDGCIYYHILFFCRIWLF